jgi:hypothetical protein
MNSLRTKAFVILAYLLAVTGGVHAAPPAPKPPAPSADERALVQACRARLTALNRFDLPAIDRYTHRDYVGTGVDGGRIDKATLMKNYAPGSAEPPNTYGPMQELQVRIYGGTGILNYRVQLKQRLGDRDIVTELRRTDVFLKQDGRWQEVSANLSVIPVSHLSAVEADPSKYDDYVGDYEIASNIQDHVTREGDKLFGEHGGTKKEFLPLGSEKFFFREDTGQITFARDDEGRVNGYAYQRCDGQQIAARKVK